MGIQRRSCDVAIVGAGLAGLMTARVLAGAGLDVVVVEARQRVRGRTLTEDLGPGGAFIDHGGQWVSRGRTASSPSPASPAWS